MPEIENYLVDVKDLKTWFPIRSGLLSKTVGYVKAVDGVSFRIRPGKTLGLVGESGCGKTTVGRTMLRLIPPAEGRFLFNGEDVFAAGPKRIKQFRRDMQMMFQDPYGSLNPE
jgi:ABC-type oligopeptide transport system ATPase subunit